ncbi:MAG: alpha/beta fold hydrolase [Nitriliruptorales bacterium]|nr:alpha/beta fold hydrolase [Nitriliruptorales bacterium]
MSLLRRLTVAASTAALGIGAATVWAASRPRPMPRDSAAPEPPPDLPEGRIIHVPGHGEFFVRQTGDPSAPPVVLLHGWMFPSDLNWSTCYRPLGEIAHVIALDHRGHGRGPRPSAPFRLSDVADDVAAVLKHLGLHPAIAVGYSMGGAVAQLLWRRHPEVVRGMVLCATSASWTASPRMRWGWRAMGILQMALRLVPRPWWERLYLAQARGDLPVKVSQMVSEETPREVLDRLPWVIAELDRGSAEDVAEAGRELGRYDARSWIADVDVPTAVIITTRDSLVPLDAQRDLAARIHAVAVYQVDGDHDAVVARREEFNAALRSAVRDVWAHT